MVRPMTTPSDSITINNLRIQLPNAQVTTYMYTPLFGVRTMIDPRGIKTTFIYNDFGRLKAIRDENDKKIQEYEYHYKN